MRTRHRNRSGTQPANMRFVFGLGNQHVAAVAFETKINDLRIMGDISSATLHANGSECGTACSRSPAFRRRAAAWFNQAPEPTSTAVTPPAVAGDRAIGSRGSP